MSIKSRKARWPKAPEGSNRKTTLRVIPGGRTASRSSSNPADLPRTDAYREPGAVEMMKDLGNIAPQLVEKAGKVIESAERSRRTQQPRRKKAA